MGTHSESSLPLSSPSLPEQASDAYAPTPTLVSGTLAQGYVSYTPTLVQLCFADGAMSATVSVSVSASLFTQSVQPSTSPTASVKVAEPMGSTRLEHLCSMR